MAWIALYFLLMLALVGVAIYEHHTVSILSLPLSPALTALAIALPLIGLVNSFALPLAFAGPGSRRTRDSTPTPVAARLVQAAQLLQLVLSVVLATSFFTDAAPSAVRDCLLGTAWQRLFVGKDADAIRRIQDALQCCGFNSVRDRAWPFAEDIRRGGGVACAERYGRATSCAGPWTATLQRSAGIEGGAVTLVAVLQVVLGLLAQWIASRQNGHGRWPQRLLAQFTSVDDRDDDAGARRPLLGSGSESRCVEEEGEVDEVDGADNADEQQGTGAGHAESGARAVTSNGYGGTGARVEPSFQPTQGEANAWQDNA